MYTFSPWLLKSPGILRTYRSRVGLSVKGLLSGVGPRLGGVYAVKELWLPVLIGILRGVGGRGVGDYTSFNWPYYVLIMGIKAPTPLPPTP